MNDIYISKYEKIDAHSHILGKKADFVAMMDGLGYGKVANISWSDFLEPPALAAYEEALREDTENYPGRFLFITSFNVTRFLEPSYVDDVIAKLEVDFSQRGAVAVKIWKDLGMMLKDTDDSFVYCDDERFRPIFDWIESKQIPVVMHIADPLEAWEPLDPSKPNYGYYSQHPDYHWYGKPGKPSHGEILAHRDNLVARHPGTKFVGAHLASLEHDVKQVATFLDTFPNAYVDTAARYPNLKMQPDDDVREFIIKYQDRILYGTDWEWTAPGPEVSQAQREERITNAINGMSRPFAYFEETLALPADVLRKFYYENAAGIYR